MTARNGAHRPTVIAAALASAFFGGSVSITSVVWLTADWKAKTDVAITEVRKDHDSLEKQVAQLDVGGSRSIPILMTDVRRLEAEISRIKDNADKIILVQRDIGELRAITEQRRELIARAEAGLTRLAVAEVQLATYGARMNNFSEALDRLYALFWEKQNQWPPSNVPPLSLPSPLPLQKPPQK